VGYKSISEWTIPSGETVQISANNTTSISRSYTQTGSLQVTLGASGAVTAGAQWNVDGGSWHDSTAKVSGLSAGSHQVDYKSISGWTAPSGESVQVTANNTTSIIRSYTQTSEPILTGSLQVTLGPSGAVSAGAQWNVDGGSWNNSAATVSGLSAGSHQVGYKSISGWTAPSGETVQITANNTTSIGRSYGQSSQPQPFTLTFTGEITQRSQVDQNTFAIPALGSVVIDVQAWEAHQGQGRTTDFFGDGDKNNDLDSEMHLFKNGTLVGTGGKGPGSNITRTCRDPYLNTNVTPGTYMVAIGSGPLTWQDALAKNNTDGSLWSDHWYGTFNYNKYRIIVTYQPN
jgi:hypothetical protein